MQELSRDELYGLVWQEPLKTVAPKFGVSDVALAKVCRKNLIPVPPRGYWAKVHAKKPAARLPLPRRGLGMSTIVHLGPRIWSSTADEDTRLLASELPPPPVFDESVDELVGRVKKLVGKVARPSTSKPLHPALGRLIADDEARVKASASGRWSWHRPLFASPYERRRLALVSTIFYALQRCGMRGATSAGKDPETFTACIGEVFLRFSIDAARASRNGFRSEADLARKASETQSVKIDWWRDHSAPVPTNWTDSKEAKLETQLTEVVVSLIVLGEMSIRIGAAQNHQLIVSRKAELTRKAVEAKERLENEARKALLRRKKEEVQSLIRNADRLAQARRIRELVEATVSAGRNTSEHELARWTQWALRVADRIDPIVSGGVFQMMHDESRNEGCAEGE